MAYIKQDWTTGDKITAEKLNYMEDGISNALTEVDASELVDNNSLIKAENNKLDIKYSELKGDIVTDITTGSNYIDDVNGKIDVDYDSLKSALDADLLMDNDSTLSTMCGSSLQITDSKLRVNAGFLAGEGLMASQSNKIEVNLATVGGDLVENSNYLIADSANGTTTLNVNMDTLPSALAGKGLAVGQEGKLAINVDIPSVQGYQDGYGDYAIITNSSRDFDVPTINYMETYVAEQGGGEIPAGNVTFENVGGDLFGLYSDNNAKTLLTQFPMFELDSSNPDLLGKFYAVMKTSEEVSSVLLPNIVYHDNGGFYKYVNNVKTYITI